MTQRSAHGEDVIGLNTTFDSPLIQFLARQAAERCTGDGDYDAIAAVILSYSALEAFLNELTQLASTLLREDELQLAALGECACPQPTPIRELGLAMSVAQEQRASTTYRYDLAWQVLSGVEIDRGKGARQDLATLTGLRNDLAHAKS